MGLLPIQRDKLKRFSSKMERTKSDETQEERQLMSLEAENSEMHDPDASSSEMHGPEAGSSEMSKQKRLRPRQPQKQQPLVRGRGGGEETGMRNCYKRWTEKERKLLLAGLEAHGPRDLAKITEVVGTRNRHEVMCAIKYWKAEAMKVNIKNIYSLNRMNYRNKCKGRGRFAQRNYRLVDGIELWMEMLSKRLRKIGKGGLSNLAAIMKMIASFEALPTVEEADGIDFRELYLWLAEVIGGQPMRSLSVPTAEYLSQCTRDLSKTAADNKWPRYTSVLSRVVNETWSPLQSKSYSSGTDVPDNMHMDAVLQYPGINAVGIDMNPLDNHQLFT
ncbi:uncharacterized protein LOC120348757 [Nilaparvata lugens]|uniref:uncharacterized protein LOC120348757 n=1 Tax=Nilaparvata lugens TaxID=108931 RepID=UPI00193DF5BC|nr:uncharacterized protein LOC120348757 [Nilaparvata lugens]